MTPDRHWSPGFYGPSGAYEWGSKLGEVFAERDRLRAALTEAIELAARTGNLTLSHQWAELLAQGAADA